MTVQYSIQKMVSDGTLSTIALGIQYLQRNDIYMRIAGEETPQSGAPSGYTWSFIDNTTVKILPNVPSGIEVIVYRRTDVNAMYNIYSQNAQFDESTIDENNQQLLYIAQEYLEQGVPGAGVDSLEYVNTESGINYYRFRLTDGAYTPVFGVPDGTVALRAELVSPLGVKIVGNTGINVNSVAGLLPLPLVIGDVVNLACYHFILDNSNHVRVIEASDNGSGVQLNNGLWANIPLGAGEVDISWLGAKRQVGFDSLAIIHKALAVFKTAKFSGHYYVSSGVQMRDGYSWRGENIDTSILEITTRTGAENEGIVCYDKPVVVGQNAACIFTNLECMTLLSNINQDNWNTDGSGMVHCGIYGSVGSGLAGGVAQSAIRNIKVVGCNFVTDIKDGYLNAIDNIRGEKCHHGVSITKGTSYSIGLLSVVLVKNFCFKFDNVLYSNIKNLAADFCDVSQFLLASNSDISIGSVGAEVLTSIANMYRLSNSKVTIGTTNYISIGTTNNPADSFHYLEGGSILNLTTDNELNAGWGIKSYDVSQSDLIIGNILNIRRQVYENIYQYTSYDLNYILGFRGYGKLFQFSGGHMPGSGNWVIDFVSTSNDLGISGKGSYQVGTSLGTGEVKRRRFDGTAWTAWA